MSSYHFDFCDIVKGLYTVHLQWIAVAFINIIAFTKKKRTNKNKTKQNKTGRHTVNLNLFVYFYPDR